MTTSDDDILMKIRTKYLPERKRSWPAVSLQTHQQIHKRMKKNR